MARKPELKDSDIGELWRRYRELEGRDDHADLVIALIRKLIVKQARDIPYGYDQPVMQLAGTVITPATDLWDYV